MAVLFPITLDGVRLFVNPTKIEIQKRSQIAETRTMGGTVFQVWPDIPDEVNFEGISYGIRSLVELRGIGKSISKGAEEKLTTLIYKFRNYTGYVKNLTVSADADNPRVFNYKFSFVIKGGGNNSRFVLEDMTLGQMTSLQAEYDYIQGQIRGASTTIANVPADALSGVLSAANSISRIGLNIGRPTIPSISSFRP